MLTFLRRVWHRQWVRDIKNRTVRKWWLGFNPEECWSLDYTIAEFILPRLKYFRKVTCGYPGCLNSMDEWYEILDNHEERYKRDERVENGLMLFAEYFGGLWY